MYIGQFRGKLAQYALHERANFTITSMLARVSSTFVFKCDVGSFSSPCRELMDLMATELAPHVEDIFAENRCLQLPFLSSSLLLIFHLVNVVKTLIEASARLVVQQKAIVTVRRYYFGLIGHKAII